MEFQTLRTLLSLSRTAEHRLHLHLVTALLKFYSDQISRVFVPGSIPDYPGSKAARLESLVVQMNVLLAELDAVAKELDPQDTRNPPLKKKTSFVDCNSNGETSRIEMDD